MKYERITSRNEEPFYAFDACKECKHKIGLDKWCAYKVGAYIRLHELEDKIERGELISTVQSEQGDQEVAFFVAHNAEVRKQAVKEFVCKVLQIGSKRPLCLFNEYKEGYIDCLDQIKELAAQYGVEVEE